jgi:hypothetical protein
METAIMNEKPKKPKGTVGGGRCDRVTTRMETAIMNEKPKKPKGTVGGGRAPGQKNILPPLGKSARETLQNMLGFDDAAVARTGQINGPGVAARQRLFETLHGLRPSTPKEFLEALRFVWDRGIGTPTRMRDDAVQKPSLIFTTIHGHQPWSPLAPANREMDARSAKMNAENDAQLALEAAERAKPVVIEAEAEPELELIPPPPGESR